VSGFKGRSLLLQGRIKFHQSISHEPHTEKRRLVSSSNVVSQAHMTRLSPSERAPLSTRVQVQIEHIVPRAKDGTDRVSNICLSCEKCNKAKGTKDIKDFLKKKPDLLKQISGTKRVAVICHRDVESSPTG
jgi:5-methylcytosine-specific restriction endonuclease McrA